MTRHRLRRLSAAFVVGALPMLWATAPAVATATGPAAQGWWSEVQPSPPLAVNALADDNLHVGNDPTGPNAIAAVRYAVPGSIDGKTGGDLQPGGKRATRSFRHVGKAIRLTEYEVSRCARGELGIVLEGDLSGDLVAGLGRDSDFAQVDKRPAQPRGQLLQKNLF